MKGRDETEVFFKDDGERSPTGQCDSSSAASTGRERRASNSDRRLQSSGSTILPSRRTRSWSAQRQWG